MSMDYVIKIKLDAQCSKENIYKILSKGTSRSFTYYDHSFSKSYAQVSMMDASSATIKIIAAHEKNTDEGPAVFVRFDENTDVHLWIIESEDGYLEVKIGAFGNPKKKDDHFDLGYYVKLFLDLVDDFPVLEVRTSTF